MSVIITRAGKGSPLTNGDMDTNLINLNTDKLEAAQVSQMISDALDITLPDYAALTGAVFTGPVEVPAGATGNEVPRADEVVAKKDGAAVIPSWTTATRPTSPSAGHTGFNSDLNSLETWNGSEWIFPGITSTTSSTATGTSVEFTSIPSWVKRITISISGLSTSGTSLPIVQLGTSSYVTTNYSGSISNLTSASVTSTVTTGIPLAQTVAAASVMRGLVTLVKHSGNTWVSTTIMGFSNNGTTTNGASMVTLSAPLEKLRITTVNGTDTFDAGSIAIHYES